MSKAFVVLLLVFSLSLASGNNKAWTGANKEKNKKLDGRSLTASSNTSGRTSPGFIGGGVLLSLPELVTGSSSPSDVVFCVANSDADPDALRSGLNGQEGSLVALASFAYNDYYDYYQMLTTTDPSHGSCIFTGSTGAGRNTSTGGGSPGSWPLQLLGAGYLCSVTVLHVLMYL